MKKALYLVACATVTTGLVVGIVGCPAMNPSEMSGMDSPTANDLFRLVTETDPFENWTQFPEAVGLIESAAPHGPMARVWINGPVEDALTSFSGRLPDGSIILKESLEESTSEKATAWDVMWKVSGYDPDNNDWFWASITSDGDVNAEGRIEGCIACHGGARDNDFIFLHSFDEE